MNRKSTDERSRPAPANHDDESAAVAASPAADHGETPVVIVPEDFETFSRREYRSVLALAMVLSRNHGVAEELTQEALLDTWRRWESISGYENPRAWVRRVVANRAVSRRRRLAAEARALTRLRARPRHHEELTDPAAELWAAVRRLPGRQAQVVALTYVDDLSLAQVAEVLGISEGAAKTHLQRGRAALATALRTTDTQENDHSEEPR